MVSSRKHWLLWALVLLLAAGSGLFLYRSGFFAACTSPEALRAYISRSAP